MNAKLKKGTVIKYSFQGETKVLDETVVFTDVNADEQPIFDVDKNRLFFTKELPGVGFSKDKFDIIKTIAVKKKVFKLKVLMVNFKWKRVNVPFDKISYGYEINDYLNTQFGWRWLYYKFV